MNEIVSEKVYRVTMGVGDMGWVDLDLGLSTILPSYQDNPGYPHPPRHDLAEIGVTKMIVSPTHVP